MTSKRLKDYDVTIMTSKEMVSNDVKNDRETDDVISNWVSNDVKKRYKVESTKFELIC